MSQYIGHFSIWGDFEADEISAALGLQPSAVYPKGEMWEGAEHPATSATWDFHCPDDLTAVEQVRFLLDSLRPVADVIRRSAVQHTAEFNVNCEEHSVLSFSATDIQELANLGVGLNVFLYEDGESSSSDSYLEEER